MLTQPSRKRPTVTDVEWLKNSQNGSYPTKRKKKVCYQENVDFVRHVDEEETPVVGFRLAEWHFTKLRVSANTTRIKITEQIHKHLIRRYT